MGTAELSVVDRIKIASSRVTGKIRAALLNDEPPGVRLENGEVAPTVSTIRALSERYPLASLLPYESYDAETQLYFNTDTVGFVLYANPATGLSPISLKVLNGFFNQQHKPNATIQITAISDANVESLLARWANNKVHASDVAVKDIFDVLAKNRVKYLQTAKWDSLFSDQAYLIRDIHLLISYTIDVPLGVAPCDMPTDDLDELIRTREAAIGTFRSAKIFSAPIPPDVFVTIMSGILNPSRDPHPALQYDEDNLLNRQMVSAETIALFDSGVSTIQHRDEKFSVMPYHVRQFPQHWPGYNNGSLIGSFLDNILRLPCQFIITLTVNAPDQLSAKGKVKRKSLRATQMAGSAFSRYVPQWRERKQDWDYTAEKIDAGNRLLEAFYQIVLIAPQGREQACEQALKSIYDSIGWIVTRSRYTPIHALLGSLPMGLAKETKRAMRLFGHFSTRLSWTCTNIAPWIGEWKGTRTPMMLFTGRRGQLAYFDPFDNTKGNFNLACCATSGSGKSFLTQEWVFSCLGSGGRAFIIDAGHSYRNLCRLLNGTYIEFGNVENPIKLNPFSGITDSDEQFFTDDQMPMLKKLIAQMASPETPLSAKQQAVLEKAILRAWQSKKSEASITTVVDALQNDNSDDGPMHATAKDLAVMLHSYTEQGMYGKYFEGESNVNLDSPFVVLELDALNATPDLQSVVLLILIMRITQVMYLSGNKSQRKLCIIDEAWRLLGRGRAGEFISEGYRVARKHGGSFMTITQKISDYYVSETAKAAFMNSDFTIFLRQKQEELQNAESNKYITNDDGKIDVLRSLETIQGKYSELALNTPDGLSVVRFTVDPITEKLYSTKAEEVDFIREAESRGVPLFEAIQELINRSAVR